MSTTVTGRGAPRAGSKPIGMTEMSPRYGVHPKTPYKWKDRGMLPLPDLEVSGTLLWWDDYLDLWWRDKPARRDAVEIEEAVE